MEKSRIKQRVGMNQMKKSQLIFYISVVTIPLVWWLFSFAFTNIQTILYWFQGYDADTNSYYFNGLDNFDYVFNQFFKEKDTMTALKNGYIACVVNLLFVTVPSYLLSYYVVKKYTGSEIFKALLYVPQIISSVVLVIVYKIFADEGIKAIFGLKEGLLVNVDTRFFTLLLFMVFFQVGNGVVVNGAIMSSVSPDVVEAGKLEGITFIQEVWYIVMPAIWPTFVVTFMGVLTGPLTVSVYQFTFFGEKGAADISTLGYTMFKWVYKVNAHPEMGYLYTQTAALGAVFTLIITPVTYITRHYLVKLGPSED